MFVKIFKPLQAPDLKSRLIEPSQHYFLLLKYAYISKNDGLGFKISFKSINIVSVSQPTMMNKSIEFHSIKQFEIMNSDVHLHIIIRNEGSQITPIGAVINYL